MAIFIDTVTLSNQLYRKVPAGWTLTRLAAWDAYSSPGYGQLFNSFKRVKGANICRYAVLGLEAPKEEHPCSLRVQAAVVG